MAPCTLNPKTEKQLGGVFDLFVDLVNFAIPHDSRIDRRFARSGDDVSNKLIVRFVLVNAFPDPTIERVGRGQVFRSAFFIAEDQVPLVCEVVGVGFRFEQPINEFLSLVSRRISEKRLCVTFPRAAMVNYDASMFR